MKVRVQYRRYRLPFRVPIRTAHGQWTDREGVIVRLESEAGIAGWGEAAPIPHFGTESADEAEAAFQSLGEWTDSDRFEGLPPHLGCVRHALRAALREIDAAGAAPTTARASLGVAALLPAGRAALALVEPRAEIGFRVFKWKVGVGDPGDELAMLDDLCARLPPGAKLRLDANGAWDRRQAERWLERCAERPVEYVEQPCGVEGAAGDARRRQGEDRLLGLAADFPTPLALDESLVGDGDLERWMGLGWPGVWVVKPLLFADLDDAIERLARARARVVFSSALETAVGARRALRAAFAWPGENGHDGTAVHRALGFGVGPLFQDARFEGPSLAPFLRAEDVERLDPGAAWNALS